MNKTKTSSNRSTTRSRQQLSLAETVLTALIRNAAMDPNPTREFIFGEAFANALRPSKSNSTDVEHL